MILLDSNVLSGLMRASAEQRLVAWFRRPSVGPCHISAVSVAEVEYGIARLASGRRAKALSEAFEELVGVMTVVAFDNGMASASARFRALRERAGRPISLPDAMIAATAYALGAELATRNTPDFERLGLALIDPWSA